MSAEDDTDTDSVTLSPETVDVLVATMLYSQYVIRAQFRGEPIDYIGAAMVLGLCAQREPTERELSDPNWPGHYGQGDSVVTDFSPAFGAIIAKIEGVQP